MKVPTTAMGWLAALFVSAGPAWAESPTEPELVVVRNPVGQSVSPGARVQLDGLATGGYPLEWQWFKDGEPMEGATTRSLRINPVTVESAGEYRLRVRSDTQEVFTEPAVVDVDPRFEVVRDGPIVSTTGHFLGGAWGDCDNDGDLDLLLADLGSGSNRLYLNQGNGSFIAKVVPGAGEREVAWGDYDGDGLLDYYFSYWLDVPGIGQSGVYRNRGDGTFERATYGPRGGALAFAGTAAAWGDYDGDGDLDLLTVDDDVTLNTRRYLLHRNVGSEGFATEVVSDETLEWMGPENVGKTFLSVSDVEGDGDLDAFVVIVEVRGVGFNADLYLNRGDARWEKAPAGPWADAGGDKPTYAILGDYDNDGDSDLFVGVIRQEGEFSYESAEKCPDRLFQNDGQGHFIPVADSLIAVEESRTSSAAWADYDNDGDLDLFVASYPPPSLFYENDGAGNFTLIRTGSPVWRESWNAVVSWGDYDNDGFLDLLLGGGKAYNARAPGLYRNAGNGNAWIRVLCRGNAGRNPLPGQSNSHGIGAKVWATATINGKVVRQMREIAGGDGYMLATTLEAHFGLGDAEKIDLLRIGWPSGIVQELRDVAVRQILTVHEPILPRILSAQIAEGGVLEMTLTGQPGARCELQESGDLLTWSVVNEMEMPAEPVTHRALMDGLGQRFYRLVER